MSPARRATAVVALLFGVTSLGDTDAFAQSLDDARRAFRAGVEAQEAGQYEQALTHYGAARATATSPSLLFNIAVCLDATGHLRAALASFKDARELAVSRDERDVISASATEIDRLQTETPRITLLLPASVVGAEVLVDGQSVGVGQVLELDPGVHTISASARSHVGTFATRVVLARHDARTLDVDLGPRRVFVTTSPPVEHPSKTYLPVWIAGGAATILGGAALATGLMGHDRRARFEDLNAAPTRDNRAEREDLKSSGGTLYVTSTILLGTAVVAVGTAVYFALRPRRSSVFVRSE